jgi:iron-sulfur cluster assembly accessory protein
MLFDDAKQEDLTLSFDGTRVVIDKASAEMLRGSVVDYVDALNDSGFRITNPNARQSCGCGKSFEA